MHLCKHRGPDGGQKIEIVNKESGNGVTLGHNLLSIMSEPKNSRQPWRTPKHNSLVYNGEIFNYYELKEKYTELFKDKEKYIITNNTRDYSNGEIVYNKPEEQGITYKQRHAFTTHSIQGETATNNLYICISEMFDAKMIYTALSRAKYFNQIHLLQ